MSQTVKPKVPMHKWRRTSPIQFFEKNPGAIARPVFVGLASTITVKLLITTYEPFTRASYFVSCLARNILSDNLSRAVYKAEELFGAEQAIGEALQNLHEYFDSRNAQARQRLELAGFSFEDTRSTEAEYEARTVTNAVSNFLDVLGKADIYLLMLHYLWLTGELGGNPREADEEKQRCEREVRDAIVALCRSTEKHYQQVQRICNEALNMANERKKQREMKMVRKAKRDKKMKASHDAAQKDQNALAAPPEVVLPEITQDDLIFEGDVA